MINFKVVLSVLNIVLVQNANCIEAGLYRESVEKEQNYQPIPVAVVYEDPSERNGKSFQSRAQVNLSVNTKTKEVEDKEFKSLTKNPDPTTKITTEIINGDQVYKMLKLERHFTSEKQIPVAVVYDEPIVIVRNKSISRNKAERQHRPANEGVDVVYTTTTIPPSKQDTPKETKVTKLLTPSITSKVNKGKRERDPVVPIIESENHVYSHTGVFQYSYEGGDGTKAYSTGKLKEFDNDKTGESVSGGFSYTDKDGKDFRLSYTADENGYRPIGDHLPTPPPIPPAIARALRYLATKTTPEPVTVAVAIDDKN